MKLTKVITSSAFALTLSLSGLAVAAESAEQPLTKSTTVAAKGDVSGCGAGSCGAGSCGADEKKDKKKKKKDKKDDEISLS